MKAQLDPIYRLRGEQQLLASCETTPVSEKWHSLTKPPPTGPVIDADINQILEVDTIHLSRKPVCKSREASWTVLCRCLTKTLHAAINIDDRAAGHSITSSEGGLMTAHIAPCISQRCYLHGHFKTNLDRLYTPITKSKILPAGGIVFPTQLTTATKKWNGPLVCIGRSSSKATRGFRPEEITFARRPCKNIRRNR